MAERLILLLKDRIHHVNKDKGFRLQRNLNIALSAYHMVPHRAMGFLRFVLLYGHEAVTPKKNLFIKYAFEEQHQDALSSHIKKKFKIQQKPFSQTYVIR